VLEMAAQDSAVLLSLKKSVATMTIDKMNIESQDGRRSSTALFGLEKEMRPPI